MAHDRQHELTPSEVDALLGRRETGVLSLAEGDEPYSIPISYGYDSTDRRFFMRLVSTPDSAKRRFLASSPDCRLVVYDEDDPRYESVVATGTLESISRDEMTVEHVEQFGRAKRPLFEIWSEPKPDLSIELYELRPDDLSGRRVVVDRED